jgi:hypothetical protein
VASGTKRFILKGIKLSVIQHLEQWIVYTPLSINVLVTLATGKHLECHCKALFETPCAFHVLANVCSGNWPMFSMSTPQTVQSAPQNNRASTTVLRGTQAPH